MTMASIELGMPLGLPRPWFWNLAGPAAPPQQSPDVVGMVGHAELLLDQPGDAFQRPPIGGVTVGSGPFGQQRQQSPALGFRQFARPARDPAAQPPG